MTPPIRPVPEYKSARIVIFDGYELAPGVEPLLKAAALQYIEQAAKQSEDGGLVDDLRLCGVELGAEWLDMNWKSLRNQTMTVALNRTRMRTTWYRLEVAFVGKYDPTTQGCIFVVSEVRPRNGPPWTKDDDPNADYPTLSTNER